MISVYVFKLILVLVLSHCRAPSIRPIGSLVKRPEDDKNVSTSRALHFYPYKARTWCCLIPPCVAYYRKRENIFPFLTVLFVSMEKADGRGRMYMNLVTSLFRHRDGIVCSNINDVKRRVYLLSSVNARKIVMVTSSQFLI